MKKFEYNFTYKGKSYKDVIESQMDLDTYGGECEKTLMNILTSKYGFDSEFTYSSRSKIGIKVSRVKEQGNTNNQSSETSEIKNTPSPEAEIKKAEARKAEAEASARKAEAKSQQRINLMNNLFEGLNADSNEVKEKTDYISKIVLSNDVEELTNQLNEISSLWGTAKKFTNSDHSKAVKKAAYEKYEFGMMKLEQIGSPSQIEFFKKKLNEMKPKKFFGLF